MIEKVIERNKEDIEQLGKYVKKLDKLHSKELAGKIQSLLIDEVLRLAEQNRQLRIYLDGEKQK